MFQETRYSDNIPDNNVYFYGFFCSAQANWENILLWVILYSQPIRNKSNQLAILSLLVCICQV